MYDLAQIVFVGEPMWVNIQVQFEIDTKQAKVLPVYGDMGPGRDIELHSPSHGAIRQGNRPFSPTCPCQPR